MKTSVCPLCGILRIDGVPRWSFKNTETTNANVAAIVCQYAVPRDGKECINPCGTDTTGATDSWEIRSQISEALEYDMRRALDA